MLAGMLLQGTHCLFAPFHLYCSPKSGQGETRWMRSIQQFLSFLQKEHLGRNTYIMPQPCFEFLFFFFFPSGRKTYIVKESKRLWSSPPANSYLPGTGLLDLSWDFAKDLAFMGKHSFTCPPNPSSLLLFQPSQLSYVNQVGDTR